MKYLSFILVFAGILLGQDSQSGAGGAGGAKLTPDSLSAPISCIATNSGNNYSCTGVPNVSAYTSGTRYRFKPSATNTNFSSLNINSLGAKFIEKLNTAGITDVEAGEIQSGEWVDVVYDGTYMIIQNTAMLLTVVRADRGNTYTTGIQDMHDAQAIYIPRVSGGNSPVSGELVYDTTGDMVHLGQASADAKVPLFTITPTNNDCVKWIVSGSKYTLGDTACSGGGGANAVLNDQSNAYSTGDQDFTNATSLTLPSSNGCTTSADGQICFDTNWQMYHVGSGGDAKIAIFSSTPADKSCVYWRNTSNNFFLLNSKPCYVIEYSQGTSVTVTTNSETSFLPMSLGAVDIGSGTFIPSFIAAKPMHVCIGGLLTTAAVPGTMQLKFKLSTTVVADTGTITPPVSLTNSVFKSCFDVVPKTLGTSGTVMVNDFITITGATMTTPAIIPFSNPTIGTATTLNTTTTKDVNLTVTFSLASTNSITLTEFTVE